MSEGLVALIAFAVFGGIPLTICGWAFWLSVRDSKRADALDEEPHGDTTGYDRPGKGYRP